MEPGFTIKGEVADGSNVQGLPTQLARDNHAIGGVSDRNTARFVDHRTGEIEIGRWSVARVSRWQSDVLNDSLGDVDRGGNRVAAALRSTLAINIEGPRIKDRISAIDDVNDFGVVYHHVIAKQHHWCRIRNGN